MGRLLPRRRGGIVLSELHICLRCQLGHKRRGHCAVRAKPGCGCALMVGAESVRCAR